MVGFCAVLFAFGFLGFASLLPEVEGATGDAAVIVLLLGVGLSFFEVEAEADVSTLDEAFRLRDESGGDPVLFSPESETVPAPAVALSSSVSPCAFEEVEVPETEATMRLRALGE